LTSLLVELDHGLYSLQAAMKGTETFPFPFPFPFFSSSFFGPYFSFF